MEQALTRAVLAWWFVAALTSKSSWAGGSITTIGPFQTLGQCQAVRKQTTVSEWEHNWRHTAPVGHGKFIVWTQKCWNGGPE